jgi:hypothetical protein
MTTALRMVTSRSYMLKPFPRTVGLLCCRCRLGSFADTIYCLFYSVLHRFLLTVAPSVTFRALARACTDGVSIEVSSVSKGPLLYLPQLLTAPYYSRHNCISCFIIVVIIVVLHIELTSNLDTTSSRISFHCLSLI